MAHLYEVELSRISKILKKAKTGEPLEFKLNNELGTGETRCLMHHIQQTHPNIELFSRGYGHPMMDVGDYKGWFHCQELAGWCYSSTGEYRAISKGIPRKGDSLSRM